MNFSNVYQLCIDIIIMVIVISVLFSPILYIEYIKYGECVSNGNSQITFAEYVLYRNTLGCRP